MHYLNLKNKTGTIRLNSGHSLILGHKPDKLKLEQVGNKMATEKQEVASLGLFDYASPNYTTYYPDVTVEDLSPKDADFIHPVYRMLSETILSKGIPIDFGKKGVIKESINMMLGQSVNIDHETAVGNAVGAVSEVKWQNSYQTESGQVIPAGFNAVLKIDGKSNPRIARGIMMDPPSIHSNSVTVRFAWEPSHKFENDNEFYHKLGTYDKKGELIRLIVIKIKQYSETSLVGHGADPYAQKIGDDGKIINPEYASTVYSFAADKQEVDIQHIDYKDTLTFSFKAHTIPDSNKLNNNNNNNHSMDLKQLIAEVEKQFGLDSGSITVENFTEKLAAALADKVPKADLTTKETELSDANSELATSKGRVTTLEGEVTNLKTEVQDFKDNPKIPDELLTATRAEAVKFYKLIKGDKVNDTIVASMKSADYKLAMSQRDQYKAEAEEKFPDVCQDCSSTNISKASARVEDDDDEKGKGEVISNAEAMKKILDKRQNKKKSIALGYSKTIESKK